MAFEQALQKLIETQELIARLETYNELNEFRKKVLYRVEEKLSRTDSKADDSNLVLKNGQR